MFITNGQQFNSIFYVVVVILIAIPLWFKTTSPVRHDLPNIQMLTVDSQRINNKISINIVDAENDLNDLDLSEIKSNLKNFWSKYLSIKDNFSFEFEWRIRKINKQEESIFQILKNTKTDLNEIDTNLDKLESHKLKGTIWIYLISDKQIDNLSNKFDDIVYGSFRFFYLKRKLANTETISNLVHSIIDSQPEYFNSEDASFANKASKNCENGILNRELIIYLNILPENIEDSISFQNSSRLNSLHKLTEIYFLKKSGIRQLINVKVIDQMIHYALPDNFDSEYLFLKDQNERLIDLNLVPQILNKIESRIIPSINKYSLKFNIILPSSKNKPLYFYDKKTNLKSNSIVTFYQASTVIWNNENDFNLAFKSFIRKKLGLSYKQSKHALKRNILFAKWEIENLIRKTTLKQLSRTIESLESTEKLLKKVSNIVIEKKISTKMFDAVNQAYLSIKYLSEFDLEKAFECSSKAFKNSEEAFYDPSLLSLLYFPEDQKYAIYLPLFFPIALQLISYFANLRKYIFKQKQD